MARRAARARACVRARASGAALAAALALVARVAVAAPPLPSGARRLLAIADVHGDLGAAARALALAGVAAVGASARDGAVEWLGGNYTTLIQTGDQVDRGPDSLEVLELFEALTALAASSGGRAASLVGNHELMVLAGEHRYAHREELAALAARDAAHGAGAERAAARAGLYARMRSGAQPRPPSEYELGSVADGQSLWVDAFGPGGAYFELVTNRPTALVEGEGACKTLFVHAGVLPQVLRRYGSLTELSAAMQASVRDARSLAARHDALQGSQGPLWTRHYAEDAERVVCASLERVLADAGASRMVVGHTVQREARHRCEGRLVLLDTGMSAIYNGHPSVFGCDEAGGPDRSGTTSRAWLVTGPNARLVELPAVEPPQSSRHRSEL